MALLPTVKREHNLVVTHACRKTITLQPHRPLASSLKTITLQPHRPLASSLDYFILH